MNILLAYYSNIKVTRTVFSVSASTFINSHFNYMSALSFGDHIMKEVDYFYKFCQNPRSSLKSETCLKSESPAWSRISPKFVISTYIFDFSQHLRGRLRSEISTKILDFDLSFAFSTNVWDFDYDFGFRLRSWISTKISFGSVSIGDPTEYTMISRWNPS